MHQRVHPKMHEMNMTEGSILKKLIIYALPLIGTNVLQLLFNATDVVVLGMLVNEYAVGAVGSTSSLIALLVSVCVGFSAGASVVISRRMGEKDLIGARKAVGTAILLSLISGATLLIIGVTCSRYFLGWMDTDPLLIEDATKYMIIYFMGVPIIILYNFIASILRAAGDTFRPLLYLMIGGVVNVGLNIFCILVLNLTVEGVAIATITAQLLSVILSLIALFKNDGYSKLELKYLKLDKKQLKEIVLIGLPSGLQSLLFGLSNVIIQSNINAFGADTVAANTASAQLDGFLYTIGNAIALSCMAFVSQNYGAGKLDRVKKTLFTSIILTTILLSIIGVIMVLLADVLLKIVVNSPQVIEYAKIRLTVLGLTYFMCAIMECLSFSLRALGKSINAMILSLIGACGFRILWLNTIFLLKPTRVMLYLSWPISWVLTIAMYIVALVIIMKKTENRMPLQIPPKQIQGGHITVKQMPTRKP